MSFNLINIILVFLLLIILILSLVIIGYILAPIYIERLAYGDDATYKIKENDVQYPSPKLNPQLVYPKLCVDDQNGLYSISFGEGRVLEQGVVRIQLNNHWFSSYPEKGEKLLKLIKKEEYEDENALGKHKVTCLIWQAKTEIFHTIFREFKNSNFLIFECSFPERIKGLKSKDFNSPNIIFPSLKNLSPNRKVFSFRNDLFAPPTNNISKPTSSPVIFYDENLNTFIISPLNNFLTSLIYKKTENRFECGLEGEIKTIPQNFSFKIIIYFGKGINASFVEWGDILLKYYESKRKSPYSDPILSYLGFWTDNGAYYYYRTEKGLSYEETLEKINDYSQSIDLPLKYFQLDSWWYKKAFRWMPFRIIKLFIGGNLEWAPIEKNFPKGLKHLSNKLDKPLIAHNRWFDKNNTHFKEFPSVKENWWGHPITYDFWEMIMKRCQDFGIVTYEQDWLKNQFDHFKYLRENVHTAHQWLSDMAIAANNHDITIQYCMPTPGFFLQSIEFEAVTQIRCTHDYNARFPKSFYIPNFTQTSLLAYSIGLWPFLDCFMSSSRPYKRYNEKFPELNTLMSILSGGLVGPADQIGYLNKKLLMKTCRSDGLLLKPDRPATPIDKMFQKHAKYYIVSTETQKDKLTWYYIVMINMFPKNVKDHSINLKELGIEEKYILYDFDRQKVQEIDNNSIISIDLKKNRHFYFILAPIINQKYAFIGDMSKYVTCSNKQFPEIKCHETSLEIKISSLKGEKVPLILFTNIKPQKIVLGKDAIPQLSHLPPSEKNFWYFETQSKSLRIQFQMPSDEIKLEISF